ncbi:probable (S)-N-methylcoclaurine 3'-hydroxylase isozyme 2 [Manihot esculenta]|uniref:Uncharacterized protein n=1 Tax=Manihot esculenta TaxID=3983 RepID=A0ACC8DJP5_MANES|nr:probable (S)-N-methylcoclaurine 3'-hydroxylase isozyme 2 [Manihot esculenta]OAY48615.2 hypothetical protein MANES_06G144500v8 [Manihot esculenta]
MRPKDTDQKLHLSGFSFKKKKKKELRLSSGICPISKHISSLSSNRRPLPPGPRPWPIVGNIFHLDKKLHISMTRFAKLHGPLISLRLGTQVVVVGSSPAAAAEILKNNDRLLSARWTVKVIPRKIHELERLAVIWNPTCNDQWKSLRTLFRTELFSAKAIESQANLREKKLSEMVELLTTQQGTGINIGEIVFATVFNTISNLIFSKDLIALEDKGVASGLKSLFWRMMELAAAPNIAEFYPILEGLDPQGLRRKMSECLEQMFGVWEIYIKERREKHVNDAPKTDFLDVFLSSGFDDDLINWLIAELMSAGVETTTTTVEWAMAEILKNKRVMEKVGEELQRVINSGTVHESQVSQLTFVNAVLRETLRLHPPAPFLLPHRAPETCEVMNYTIPKDSQIFVNVWAIGRDPSVWEEPLSFKPERFLESSLDLKGHDFELIPFGSGRRICPGLTMATRQIPMILASLIHYFEWSLENGEDLATIDMNDKFGVTLQKEKPLRLIPRRKL